MEIFNIDLINSCRVCRSPNQDADYECLYVAPTAGGEILPAMSQAGLLYEELLGELSPETFEQYPRYLCNSCDLQMRLFKKLKDKALKTMEYLSQITLDKQIQRLDSEEEEMFTKHITKVNEYDRVNEQYEEHNQMYSELEQVLNEPVYNHGYPKRLRRRTIACIDQLPAKRTHMQEDSIDLQQQHLLEAVDPEVGEFVIPDTEHTSTLDKSDYVLEIYELVEDGTKNLQNENLVEGEEISNIDSLDGFKIEVGTESQVGFDDDQYLESEELDFESYRDEIQTSGVKRSQKRKFKNGDRKREYTCTVCSEIFTNSKDFKHHSEFIHAQVYSCHICSSILKTRHSLSVHMKIHDETPTFQCEICQRTFTQKTHFQYHMNRHNNIRNFKCEECGKAFIGKTDLKIHMRLHNGDRPYVCEICGKDYKLSEHLKSHALKHTDQQFPCDLCHQNFATPKTLRQHKQTIHAEEPKFKCQLCLKPFRRKHHLQYHLKQLHPSTDILTESLYDVIDDPEINVDDDLQEHQELLQEAGYVALNDDPILV